MSRTRKSAVVVWLCCLAVRDVNTQNNTDAKSIGDVSHAPSSAPKDLKDGVHGAQVVAASPPFTASLAPSVEPDCIKPDCTSSPVALSGLSAVEFCRTVDVHEECVRNATCAWCFPKYDITRIVNTNMTATVTFKTDASEAMACRSFAECHNCEVHQVADTCNSDVVCKWCDNGLSHHCTNHETTCVGCDGVPGSKIVLDQCGVCGGSDDSCVVLTDQHFIGIVLSLMGNMLISFSLNCQKYAHNMNAKRAEPIPYQKMRLWWVGLGMMALGETGNFLAYAYAPATLVAPLGAVTVISNSMLAHFLLKEPWTVRNGFGCFLAVVGSIMIVTFAPSSSVELTMDRLVRYMTEPMFITFVSMVVCAAVALIMAPQSLKEKYVFVYLGICSLMGCVTVMCTKGVSKALVSTLGGHNEFVHFLPWVLLAGLASTIFVQVKYLNMAMIHFGASEVVPVFYVMFTFCSILGGIILFKEFHEHGRNYTAYFLTGCMMTFSGVFCITYQSNSDKSKAARQNETVDPFDDLRMDAESMQLLSTGVDPDIDDELEESFFDETVRTRNHLVAPE